MQSKKEQIRERAVEIIKGRPEGIRWTELVRELQKSFSGVPERTITTSTQDLYKVHDRIHKPSRGLWMYRSGVKEQGGEEKKPLGSGWKMHSKTKQIRERAVEIIKGRSQGIRWAELLREIHKSFPDMALSRIAGATHALYQVHDKIYKPSRGLWMYRFNGEGKGTEEKKPQGSIREEAFYEPFASYIRDDLGECTEAVTLGGNCFGKKWGTPDVIGIYKPSTRNIIKFQPEIVSAEIKLNPADTITAFGQCVAYRLFSSKVYLVEPKTMSAVDQDRLDALCVLFGIGLILFSPDPENPHFEIRVRGQRHLPDMFYVNEFADKLYEADKTLFNRLF